MAKPKKAPAWARALAERLAAPLTSTPTNPASTKATKQASKKPSKKKPSKKAAKVVPGYLARVLTGASTLPNNDLVRLACERRLNDLLDDVQGDTKALAGLLGIEPRSAQRLRAAYGMERRLVNGVWR